MYSELVTQKKKIINCLIINSLQVQKNIVSSPSNPWIYPWEATEKGCEFECESVGVLAFHSCQTPSQPTDLSVGGHNTGSPHDFSRGKYEREVIHNFIHAKLNIRTCNTP